MREKLRRFVKRVLTNAKFVAIMTPEKQITCQLKAKYVLFRNCPAKNMLPAGGSVGSMIRGFVHPIALRPNIMP